MTNAVTTRQFWQNFSGSNLGYIAELYENFLADPNSVDSDTRAMFETWGAPPIQNAENIGGNVAASSIGELNVNVEKVLAAQQFARNIREYGHLETKLDPLSDKPKTVPQLSMASFHLTDADLASIPSAWIWPDAPAEIRTAKDAIARLREVYTSTLAYDFAHVHSLDEREWLRNRVEAQAGHRPRTTEEKLDLLKRLVEVEEFERYLHKTFVGQKRFSIEGLDMLVPMLDNLAHAAVNSGTSNVFIGMAHRGRLNVLAHVLGKPYAKIFSEFHAAPNKELVPSEGSTGINYGWTGDVKYHLGASKTVGEDVRTARLTLANNPSHLEFVNPVVEGFTRAAQDTRTQAGSPTQNYDKALAVVIHGDAAFPGEGIVQETLNMSQVEGFHVGGSIHIIANNQLGFTAEPNESRSTRYSSDLAKGFEIPIVHVCADDPEACLDAIELAHEYRQKFKKDFLVDLIGFRKWGHNEMDDPSMTQPLRYVQVNAHPGVRHLYTDSLKQQGVISDEQIQALVQEVQSRLRDAYNELAKSEKQHEVATIPADELSTEATGVAVETLKKITDEMLTYPEGFTVYPKLDRILQRRRDAFNTDGLVDWAHAEALAFATILSDGTPIRLTGQDSERGTFGHRHLVLHDVATGAKFSPLHRLPEAKASFAIHNSPLSEGAIIGFEYGYNIEAPETLVLWEAQFGDFANAGQVLIDQFLSSGHAKWKQPSGLVMLLPHGYEGQGPEHSSARLERFLQMSAEHNWTVVNLSSSAQYFHLLRLQAKSLAGTPRPLIVMSPKSLLRNPKAGSKIVELNEGAFMPVVEEPLTSKNGKKVTRLVLCSGKVSLDLQGALDKDNIPDWLSVARVEQLYPFPERQILDVVNRFPNLQEIVWLQEEPRNMGAWTYIQSKLIDMVKSDIAIKYVGRPERSSPAEGFAEVHEATQKQIVLDAITK